MSEIRVPSDMMLCLLEEVGKNRALADHESDMVERIVRRTFRDRAKTVRIRWTSRMDLALVRAAVTPGGIKRFALTNGMGPQCAYDRLCKLRKAKARKESRKGMVGV